MPIELTEVPTLAVTESASAYMAQMLAQEGATDDTVLRMISKDNNLSLVLDEVRPDDVMYEHDGKIVLVFDKDVSNILADRTFDVKATDEGAELSLS